MQLDHYWVIMDKKRGLIATTSARGRRLSIIGSGNNQICVYRTKHNAELGFAGLPNYIGKGVDEYIEKNYGFSRITFSSFDKTPSILEAVEVEVTVMEK